MRVEVCRLRIDSRTLLDSKSANCGGTSSLINMKNYILKSATLSSLTSLGAMSAAQAALFLGNPMSVGASDDFGGIMGALFRDNSFEGSYSNSQLGLRQLTERLPIRVGFRFDRDGNLHYGTADFEYAFDIRGNGSDIALAFSNVVWNDVAGESIAANAIPEPASAATGLGLLALGTVGLRSFRRSGLRHSA